MHWIYIGDIASAMGALQGLVQAYRVVKERRDYHALLGFSIPAWLFGTVASSMWLAYGISKGDFPLISNNIIWVSCELTIVGLVTRAHIKERRLRIKR